MVIKSHLISPCNQDIQYKYEKFQNSVCYVHIVPWVTVRLPCIMEKRLVSAFFNVSIDYLFDNLESGKRSYCLGKTFG